MVGGAEAVKLVGQQERRSKVLNEMSKKQKQVKEIDLIDQKRK